MASVPLLMVHFAEGGNTNMVVPIPVRRFVGVLALVNLGEWSFFY